MDEAIDYRAIDWIRQELGETLKQARRSLEAYAQQPDDLETLLACRERLHQAGGSLQMVGLREAGLLVVEMGLLVEVLAEDRMQRAEAVMEHLLQAFYRLDEHLERIKGGQAQAAGELLPLVNVLRELRGVNSLTQVAGHMPDLSTPVPASAFDPKTANSLPDIREVARIGRRRFQSGLLGWYRTGEMSGLQQMYDVLVELQRTSRLEPAARLWWLGAGLAEVLLNSAMPASQEVKRLFGQVDRQLKQLIDVGEAAFVPAIPQALLKDLLLQITTTPATGSERAREIIATYDLQHSGMPAAPQPCCSAELLSHVTTVALEELACFRDRLESGMPDLMHSPAGFEGLAAELHGFVNSLDVAGMACASQALAECEQRLRDIGVDKTEMTGEVMQELAGSIIDVEEMLKSGQGGDEEMLPGWQAADSAYRGGLVAAAKEIVTDMVLCRNAIDDYLNSPDRTEQLESVPVLLNRVQGALQVIGQERTALLAAQVSEYLEHALIAAERLPDEWQLNTLADAFCSIEYHVAELGENRNHGEMVLDSAEQALLQLARRNSEPRVDGAVTNRPPNAAGSPTGGIPVISALPVLPDDVDEEIIGIFFEEVEGELRRLADHVPRWVEEPDSAETLDIIRRSFHTLKGGARMVGALALGEFSRVFEHLLNQVSAGTIQPDAAIRENVQQSLEPLAQLLAQLRGGAVPVADVDAVAAQAVRLASPDTTPVSRSSELAPEGDVPAGDLPSSLGGEPTVSDRQTPVPSETPAGENVTGLPVLVEDADPEIIEVFLEESAEVLAVLVGQLPVWTREPDNGEVLATIRRCFHTLKGSGRVAGAMLIGEFCWTIENLLNRVIDASVPVTEDLIALLTRVPDTLAELLNQVSGGPPPDADYQTVMVAAGNLARCDGGGLADGDTRDAAAQEPAGTQGVGDDEPANAADPVLLDIFVRESLGHLELVAEFVRRCDHTSGMCGVSEELYRALHTLSGISESAQVTSVQVLAADLYAYFAQLKEARQPVDGAMLAVLRDCARAIGEVIERLPDMSYDTDRHRMLQERIAGLPPATSVEEARQTGVAGEGLTAGTLMDDPSAPGPSAPVGLSVTVGEQTATTRRESETQPDGDSDSFAGLDPELLEVFLEEAGEIIESSENTLHAWARESVNGELLKEFQRQLHTLKGGARMADIQALGDLSHSLESLVTRVADGHVAAAPALFELLHEAHDRLADMLEQVKSRHRPVAAGVLEQRLDGYAGDESEVNPAVITVVAGEQPSLHEEVGSEAVEEERITGTLPEPGSLQEPQPGSHSVEQPVFGPLPWSRQAKATPPTLSCVSPEQADDRTAQPDETRQGEVLSARAERRKSPRIRGEQVRVQADLLDSMVNSAGEISIYRSRLEQQASDYRFNLAEFDRTISRLREQLRQFEIETESQVLYRHGQQCDDRNPDFDPLEMDRYSNLQQQSRLLLESINDLHSIQQMLESTTRELETLLLQQSRVSTDLQEGLMRTRMIPFAGLVPRLRRIVRQAAQELDKQVELAIYGADGEMDRTVIERIIAPLEHMLRNAVDHGIETNEQRLAAGKPETGTITISFHREGPEIVLDIADDGRGVDVDVIRKRACEQGLIGDGDKLHDSEIMQFILRAGFTTASKVTQISGRGVGMDVVVSEVKQLGGSLHIDSTPGSGSVFTIRLPYTLAINQALLVRACDDTFCIPLGNIEGVIRVAPVELAACLDTPAAHYEYAGNSYQLQHLGTLLGLGTLDLKGIAGRVPILLVRLGEKRVAIIVEALFGHREIVVKPLGAQLSHVDGVSGATILGDGRVVLILDPGAVLHMGSRSRIAVSETSRDAGARLAVMVVDDSITVRKVTARLLQKYGFEVVTARDGVDALGLLQDTVPDIMLLDVEMPRMDGFELATLMRNDERFRHVPVIMITSRTGEKHRERASHIGIECYLGKPYQEHELIDTIHRLIGLPDNLPRSTMSGAEVS